MNRFDGQEDHVRVLHELLNALHRCGSGLLGEFPGRGLCHVISENMLA